MTEPIVRAFISELKWPVDLYNFANTPPNRAALVREMRAGWSIQKIKSDCALRRRYSTAGFTLGDLLVMLMVRRAVSASDTYSFYSIGNRYDFRALDAA